MFEPLVKVGGYNLPEPSEYKSNTATMVDGGRNAEGKFIGALIRDDVAKIDIGWKYLTTQEWANINRLFDKQSGGKFENTVQFYDQSKAQFVTKTMYVSDRSAGMWRRDSETGQVKGWVDCRLALIEV